MLTSRPGSTLNSNKLYEQKIRNGDTPRKGEIVTKAKENVNGKLSTIGVHYWEVFSFPFSDDK